MVKGEDRGDTRISTLINLSYRLVRESHFEKACVLIQNAIEINPRSFDANLALGLVKRLQGRPADSIQALTTAIDIKPSSAEAFYNLALSFEACGEVRAARIAIDKAATLDENNISYLRYIERLLDKEGSDSQLVDIYRYSIKSRSDLDESFIRLGFSYQKEFAYTEALACYHSISRAKKRSAPLCINMALCYQNVGEIRAAVNLLANAIRVDRFSYLAHFTMGNMLKLQGCERGAIGSYKEALSLNPSFHAASFNLGNLFKAAGNLELALLEFRRAVKLDPRHAESFNNLGSTLIELGRTNEAILALLEGLSLDPISALCHLNLGICHHMLGSLSAAKDSFKQAIRLSPSCAEAHLNLSLVQLLKGDYINGLREFEWRYQAKNWTGSLVQDIKLEKWDGRSSLENKKLLLLAEQGLGDTIQFFRYALVLKRQGVDVAVAAQAKLGKLIVGSGVDFISVDDLVRDSLGFDLWYPLMSLPWILEVTAKDPRFYGPYVQVSRELLEKWNTNFCKVKRPLVALNWQGNKKAERAGLIGRSIELELFSTVSNQIKGSLVSLQKGFGSEQMLTCSFKDKFTNKQEEVDLAWDFDEAAAIILNSDLVITTDTAMAHLSGALGKETWLLLTEVPDWRWGLKGHTTLWYKEMRLFRQKQQGEWSTVMSQLGNAMQRFNANYK